MTVELRYNKRLNGLDTKTATAIIDALDAVDGTESSSGGTFTATFARYQFPSENDTSELHFDLQLRDSDDSDYPDVKDDLAQAVADLHDETPPADEVEPNLSGQVQ